MSHSGRGSKSHFDVAGTDFTFCYKLEPDGVLGCRCHHVSLSFDWLPRSQRWTTTTISDVQEIVSHDSNLISGCELPFPWSGRKLIHYSWAIPPWGYTKYQVPRALVHTVCPWDVHPPILMAPSGPAGEAGVFWKAIYGPVCLDVPVGRVTNPLALPEIVLILVLKAQVSETPSRPANPDLGMDTSFRVLPLLHALLKRKKAHLDMCLEPTDLSLSFPSSRRGLIF